MRKIKLILYLLFSIILAVPSNAETIEQALGINNYLLATNTDKGDAYVNNYQRTFNPSINRWGTKTGTMPNGDAIITLDSWSIADVLGSNYFVIAYTPERGNCYANNSNRTYTPGTNQVGTISGYTSDGRPIINVEGTIYVKEVPTTITTYQTVPIQSSQTANPTQANKPLEDSSHVWIYPENGYAYHKTPHINGYYVQIERDQAIANGYSPCKVCYR